MRISLIHGENSTKAYEKFRQLIDSSKKKGFDIVQINDIKKIVRQSLFEEKIVFVLNKPSKIKLNDWKWFTKNAPKYNSNLLIYNDGNLPSLILRAFPKEASIEKFDLPKIIFTFLDSFWPGNSKNALKLLNELVINEPIELVFHLLSRHVRDLYWVKVSADSLEIPDWRKSKIKNQSDKFSLEVLSKVINELAEIDVKSKTSNEDLKSSLDILI